MSVYTERGHYITDISKHVLRPHSVSVRKDGNLLVCDGCDVKVLSPDGTKLIQTIKALYCYESLWNAVYRQGIFFVSYDSLHYVKTFSDEGQFLYEIGCKGSGDRQLRRPQGPGGGVLPYMGYIGINLVPRSPTAKCKTE